MGMLGAMAGLGKGIEDVADRRLKLLDEQAVMDMRNKAEIEKENRINEARRQDRATEEGYKIAGETRALSNEKTRAQNAIDVQTDPNNIAKVSNAEVEKKKTLDAYGDSRSDIEIQQAAKKAKAIDQATYHDNTDYEGRKLSHEAARLQIDTAKAESKLPPAVKEQVKSIESDIKGDYELLKLGTMDDDHARAAQERIQANQQAKNNLLQRYLPADDLKALSAVKDAQLAQDQKIADILTGNTSQSTPETPKSGLLEQKKRMDLADKVSKLTDEYKIEDLEKMPVPSLQNMLKQLNQEAAQREADRRASYVGH